MASFLLRAQSIQRALPLDGRSSSAPRVRSPSEYPRRARGVAAIRPAKTVRCVSKALRRLAAARRLARQDVVVVRPTRLRILGTFPHSRRGGRRGRGSRRRLCGGGGWRRDRLCRRRGRRFGGGLFDGLVHGLAGHGPAEAAKHLVVFRFSATNARRLPSPRRLVPARALRRRAASRRRSRVRAGCAAGRRRCAVCSLFQARPACRALAVVSVGAIARRALLRCWQELIAHRHDASSAKHSSPWKVACKTPDDIMSSVAV